MILRVVLFAGTLIVLPTVLGVLIGLLVLTFEHAQQKIL